jgi:hypothetical protein
MKSRVTSFKNYFKRLPFHLETALGIGLEEEGLGWVTWSKMERFGGEPRVRIGSKLAHGCAEMMYSEKKKMDWVKPDEHGLRLKN